MFRSEGTRGYRGSSVSLNQGYPASLFAAGEQGAWYDPSDFTTLFQNAAGTTPVTAVEQPVRLMRDKSGRGNHATAPSDAARPVLRARYNQLTYSEQIDNADWQKSNITVTPNAILAPNSTLTADLIVENTVNGTHEITSFNTLTATPANTSFVASIYVKRAVGTRNLRFTGYSGANGLRAVFNLDTLSVTNGSFGTATYLSGTITSVGNGWFLCVVSGSIATASPYANWGMLSGSSSFYTGDGTSGLYFWGAQVVTVTDNTTIGGRYQQIAAATSYDTSGFLPYLAYDGASSAMATSAIDFTGTNKMSVFAGLTKLSDAAQTAVAELSATIATNNGSFLLTAPNSAAANYNFSSKGTTQVDNTVTTYTAPHTGVISALADIGAPSNIIRVNGVQAGSSVSSQGTGNFGNYALFIGARNNASLFFNGRLYGLIVRGAAAANANQTSSIESWMAARTGVAL